MTFYEYIARFLFLKRANFFEKVGQGGQKKFPIRKIVLIIQKKITFIQKRKSSAAHKKLNWTDSISVFFRYKSFSSAETLKKEKLWWFFGLLLSSHLIIIIIILRCYYCSWASTVTRK